MEMDENTLIEQLIPIVPQPRPIRYFRLQGQPNDWNRTRDSATHG